MSNSFSQATQARAWAVDAQDAFDTWPNKTQAQKDAVLRETIRRLGVLMANVAEHLDHFGFDDPA